MSEPIIKPPFAALSALPRQRLRKMRRAARDLFDVLEDAARDGGHPVGDVLAGSPKPFTRWAHLPPDDVEDSGTGYAWYYHAHDPTEARPWTEHGHFHCYGYTELLPDGARPLALPPKPDMKKGGLVHLVGLSFDQRGAPTRLFTINRWASDEWLYPAADVVPLVDRFAIASDERFARTSRWLSAAMRLLQPQIAWLLHERDRVLEKRRRRDPTGFSEDRSVDVTSMLAFNLDRHLAALERAQKLRGR